jgi:hypothetical protein
MDLHHFEQTIQGNGFGIDLFQHHRWNFSSHTCSPLMQSWDHKFKRRKGSEAEASSVSPLDCYGPEADLPLLLVQKIRSHRRSRRECVNELLRVRHPAKFIEPVELAELLKVQGFKGPQFVGLGSRGLSGKPNFAFGTFRNKGKIKFGAELSFVIIYSCCFHIMYCGHRMIPEIGHHRLVEVIT